MNFDKNHSFIFFYGVCNIGYNFFYGMIIFLQHKQKLWNMIREMVKIDEDLCDGCGLCIPNCHEGALQIIDGKARLVSDLMCDGLGACLGHCPQEAITIEKREAEAYNETKVMEIMATKGENTIVAHLTHLKEHNETEYLNEGIQFLIDKGEEFNLNSEAIINKIYMEENHQHHHSEMETPSACGCPGSQAKVINQPKFAMAADMVSGQSELRQWPVQMHLVNPRASYFVNSDLLLAADCVAFAMGNFHQKYLKNRSLAIACPKLDDGMDIYLKKLIALIDEAKVNTITVMIMQVPCCGGLLQLAKQAVNSANRKVPVKALVVGLEGEILSEDWV